MYARCPSCDSTHVLNAALLAQAHGAARCARCGHKFNLLDNLFDEWPEPGAEAPGRRSRLGLAVLGSAEDLPAPYGPGTRMPGAKTGRGAWAAATVVLVLVTIANFVWTFRAELGTVPAMRALLEPLGLMTTPAVSDFRDLAQFQLVSRDVHSHPTRAGMLVLSATFVNRASRAQAWPQLELTLLDLAGEAIAARQFTPGEYFPGEASRSEPLGSQVHVPVLLEFASPPAQAVGFEIAFR